MTHLKFIPTADLCDAHPAAQVAAPMFQTFGARSCFAGSIVTIQAPEDNSKVKWLVQTPGEGRVLVIDGGGSTTCALMGGNVARMAFENGWAGAVIFGCVRDVAEIKLLELGVLAIGACPRASEKRDRGEVGGEVRFAGVTFRPGELLFADEDGVVTLPPKALDLVAAPVGVG